ncbi:MAG: ATP-binding protein [Alphaproteobacteria bacterium]|nr:ATP-binding protein [Alphaproteobacteria bacterium]
MKPVFVHTANTAKFLAAYSALERRGAAESCLMVIHGKPGVRKSKTVKWFATQNGCPVLTGNIEWKPASFLRALLTELQVTPAYSFERMFQQALLALAAKAEKNALEKLPYFVVIDEAEYISRNLRIMETIRALSDALEIPFLLVGMERIKQNIQLFEMAESRAGQYVEFLPESLADTAKLMREVCEVEIADDLVGFVHKHAKGLIRETMDAIAVIESHGKRQRGKPVTMVDVEGLTLFNSRKGGAPVVVRM